MHTGYPSAGRTVSVTFRKQHLAAGQNLPVQSPEVQQLLRLVEKAAAAQGQEPFYSTNLPGKGDPIAQFIRRTSGEGPTSWRVELVDATANIKLREAPTWEFSSTGVETCKTLADQVKAEFGDKVKVRISEADMRIVLLCTLALMCTGCPLPYATRSVALAGLTGDTRSSSGSASVSTNNPEVQSALKIIDQVLTSHGFVPTTDTNTIVYGSLVTYTKYTPEGPMPIDPCPSVSLKDERLVFTIAEQPSLSADSKRMLKTLKTELRSHYGADRVTTGR